MGSKHKRRESTSARLAMFKLEEAVGRRELGELRKVYDEKVDRLVSMLVLPSEALPNSKSRRSFTRQFDAAKTLEHPGIVPLLEGGTNDGEGHGFLVTDYVEGQTLRKRLSEGPLPAEEAIGLAVDVLNALAYAHSRKHLHGGLSPDNVLVVEGAARPRARLAHFGFHAVVGEERESAYGGLRVDPAYAAPEMLKNEPVDPRADVYSVGALLFEMLTGRPPISAGDDPIERRLSERADALPQDAVADEDLGQRLRAALKQALEQDPSERFGSARAFALALAGQEPEREDPWAWGEACPEGGTCASSGDKIPPFAQRSWSRKQSDRPFRCRVTGKDYAGADQWDARGLCSRGARHKAIPEVKGEAPADVEFELSPPAAEASEAEAAAAEAPAKDAEPDKGDDRREALRALISSEVAWISDDEGSADEGKERKGDDEPAEAKPEKPQESAAEAAPAKASEAPAEEGKKKANLSDSTVSDVGDAMFDAWRSTQKREAAATERMRRITRKGVARPEPRTDDESPELEPEESTKAAAPAREEERTPIQPVSSPRAARSASQAAPNAGAADATPFKLAIGALVIVLVFVLMDAGKKRKVLEDQLATTVSKHDEATRKLQTELEAAYAARDGLNKTLGQERTRLGQEKAALSQQLSARTRERDGLSEALRRRESELAAGKKALADTQSELATRQQERDAARASVKSLTTSLDETRGELTRARAALQDSQAVVQTLTKQRDDLGQQVAAKNKELAQRATELASLRAELSKERDQVARLERGLQDAQAEASASAGRLRQTQGELGRAREELSQAAQRERGLQAKVAQLEGTLGKLRLAVTKAEVELAERAAERDQLDEEGLLLERWLESAEAQVARWKRAFREGARRSLTLRGLNASGQAGGPPALRPGERSAQLVVPLDQVRAWAEQGQRGEGLLTLHLRCAGGAPGDLRAQALSEAQLTQPPAGGVALKLVPLGEGSYRAFLEPEALATLLRTAPEGQASLGFTLTGGAAPATVESAELVLNPVTPDLRARLQSPQAQPLR